MFVLIEGSFKDSELFSKGEIEQIKDIIKKFHILSYDIYIYIYIYQDSTTDNHL